MIAKYGILYQRREAMAMDVVMNYLQRIENLVLTLRFWDVLDILVIALLIY